jgi:tetratricopeptide (TPR) repeat protein
MLNKVILVVFALLVVISGIYALRDDKDFTTTSDEAYKLFLESRDLQMKLYHRESYDKLLQAVEYDSNFAMALVYLAERNYAYGRKDVGEKYLNRAMAQYDKLKPHEKLYLDIARISMEGDMEGALAKIKEYVKRFPNRIYGHMMLAGRAWVAGDIQIAIDEYEKILELDPNYAPAYNSLGYLEFGNGNFAKALKHFDKYLQLLPDQANPHDSKGEILMALGRYDEALEEFKTAYQIEPTFDFVLYHMAEDYMNMGMYSRADQIFDKIQDLTREDPDDFTLLVNRGRAFWRRWDTESTLKIADSLYKLSQIKDSMPNREFWANIMYSMGYLVSDDTARAADYISRAESSYKQFSDKDKGESSFELEGWLEFARAFINMKREKYQDVLVLEKYVADKRVWRPDNAIDSKNVLAQAYFKLGDKEKAYKMVNDNLELNPNQHYTLMTLARLYEWDGKKTLAAEQLKYLLNQVWANADQDAPKVKYTREWLTRLTTPAA